MAKGWYADFKCGCKDKKDAERSGHLNLAVVLENTKKLHKLVLADHKLKLRKTAEELKISEGSVFTILHEHLSMRKLCSKWVLFAHSWKLSKDENINRQGYGLHILECARYIVHWLLWERKNYQQWILYSIINAFEGRNLKNLFKLKKKKKKKKKNGHKWKKKVLFH